MGEVRLLEDPAAAVEILGLAATQAEAARTAQIAEVARIALVSALVRLGRHDQALRVFPGLLHQLRRSGSWPQLRTSLRILAELLEALGCPRDAALLLASASVDPSAPPVTGDDVPRYRELQRRIAGQIGTGAHQRLADQAALLPGSRSWTGRLPQLPRQHADDRHRPGVQHHRGPGLTGQRRCPGRTGAGVTPSAPVMSPIQPRPAPRSRRTGTWCPRRSTDRYGWPGGLCRPAAYHHVGGPAEA